MSNNIEVLFFGELAELAGTAKKQYEFLADTETLHRQVLLDFPAFSGKSYSLALNHTLANTNQELQPGDLVAFLPPFAGG